MHRDELAPAAAQFFHHGADCRFRHVHDDLLHRLKLLAVFVLVQHLGHGDREFIAFAAHGLDQNGKVHFTATFHKEGIGVFGILHTEGNVLQKFAIQPIAQVAGGDKLAFPAGKRGVVDHKAHLKGGLSYLHKGDGLHLIHRAKGVADGDVLAAAEADDVAHFGAVHVDALQAVDLHKGDDAGLIGGEIPVEGCDHGVLSHLQRSALHPADADPTDVIVVVDGGNKHLEGSVLVPLGRVDIVDDGLKQVGEVGLLLHGHRGSAVPAAAVHDGGVKLRVIRVEVHHQFQNFVHHALGFGVGTVNFVDANDDLVTEFQRLLQNKAGLRHGTFDGVHQKQHARNHLQNALHLAGKIGVARGVDDVDLDILVISGGVLGENGDATLTLEVAAVHNALIYVLVGTENTALLEHFVNEGGLAVIDVRDDRDVS